MVKIGTISAEDMVNGSMCMICVPAYLVYPNFQAIATTWQLG